jgi:hypothetical protein
MTQAGEDEASLADLLAIGTALIVARQALVRAMAGSGGPGDRQQFVFHPGFARGAPARISARLHEAGESGPEEAK